MVVATIRIFIIFKIIKFCKRKKSHNPERLILYMLMHVDFIKLSCNLSI